MAAEPNESHEIQRRAYLIWESRQNTGRAGSPGQDWIEAEEELRKALVHPLYSRFEGRARWLKIALQMLVGAVLAILIVVRSISPFTKPLVPLLPHWIAGLLSIFAPVASVMEMPVLETVGLALALATAFELAYTLFTDGPDEAVDPVITGLAASLLIGLSYVDRVGVLTGIGLVLYVIALGGLFAVRSRFIDRS